MKPLTCEMCGSTNMIKHEGVFVCQSCGTKYSVEEAKKMMIEGTVAVEGTVKVDNSDEINNLYQLARTAKSVNNFPNAEKYYEMVLLKDPQSWEANFYTNFFHIKNCEIVEIENATTTLVNSISHLIGLVYNKVEKEKQYIVLSEIYNGLLDLGQYLDNMVDVNYLLSKGENIHQYISKIKTPKWFYYFGNEINETWRDFQEIKTLVVEFWKSGNTYHKRYLNFFNNIKEHRKVIEEYIAKIQNLEPNYKDDFNKKKGFFDFYGAMRFK